MKYEIDVRKVVEDVKTFLVEANSKEMARIEALIQAEKINWELDADNSKFFPLTITKVE